MSGGTWDDPAVFYGRGSAASYVKGLGVAVGGAAVAPDDNADLARPARGLYVGGAGDVKAQTANGDVLTFVGLPAGAVLPVALVRVYATGTTATNLLALY